MNEKEQVVKQCVMCGKPFEDKDLDYTGRCIIGEPSCFKRFMTMTEDEKQAMKGKLGVPFTPGYNSTWNK